MSEHAHCVPEAHCLNCGQLIDAASELPFADSRAPEPGDISICLYCRHIMVYGEDLVPRELTDEEIVEIAGDRELVLLVTELKRFEEWKKRQER